MVAVKIAGLRLLCETEHEVWRAKTLLTKEPGTIKWLNELKPGDVFYDVGASTGIYSFYAASRGALVYAFEPNLASAVGILRNMAANPQWPMNLITAPLDAEEKWDVFSYPNLSAGVTGGQLGHVRGQNGEDFKPVAAEFKRSITLDMLPLPKPTYLKLDVDGNELAILKGGRQTLESVRSVQVELNDERLSIAGYIGGVGFKVREKHYTAQGQQMVDAGRADASLYYNMILDKC